MNPARDLLPDQDEVPPTVGPVPTLEDLSPGASSRIVRYIVTSTLERGVAPTAVVALYADLAGEAEAVRYADRRFMLREVPADWREIENRVMDIEEGARERGLDLAAAWRRATGVAMQGEDALEQLARLAGVRSSVHRESRSIFDDPEDLDELDEVDLEAAQRESMHDRAPELLDLSAEAQRRIRRFAIEERLEHGLAAIELLDLYRGLEQDFDERARQYLDLVYVDHQPPADWIDLQAEAGRVSDVAEARGRDAGRMYADLLRASPGIEPTLALRLLFERLLAG
ncbi:MAG TPA: hypothetical protein VFG86_13270 [Chloroflexota bacterium]|jgi:hypothetical protein|nr:hypothetical protein [Chloroflexota bacterium]